MEEWLRDIAVLVSVFSILIAILILMVRWLPGTKGALSKDQEKVVSKQMEKASLLLIILGIAGILCQW